MNELELRNNRLDSCAWVVASGALAILCLAALFGLIVANLRDPKAQFMGPEVKSPQLVYFFLEGLALVCMLLMIPLAFLKATKLLDRSVQITIDATGIHDHRGLPQTIAWSEVAKLSHQAFQTNGITTSAHLLITTATGEDVRLDILGLELDHEAIAPAAKEIWTRSIRR